MPVHFQSQGQGEALVLVPGFASGAWNWFRQVPELSKSFRVVTFDPRGIGVSKCHPDDLGDLSMRSFAEDIAALMDQLGIEKAHVLGASFGGFVVQEFALAFPEKTDRLVLACTSFGGPHHVMPEPEVLSAFAMTDGLNTAERIRRLMVPAFTPAFAAAHPDVVEEVCVMRENAIVPEKVYRAQLNAAVTCDHEPQVRNIVAPTLVITGECDRVVPPANSFNLAAELPNAQLKVIEGGSHLFFIEEADEFNRSVTNFLTSTNQ